MPYWIKIVFVGAILTTTSFAGAAAGLFEDGQNARLRGDFTRAMRTLRPLAEQGQRRRTDTNCRDVLEWGDWRASGLWGGASVVSRGSESGRS